MDPLRHVYYNFDPKADHDDAISIEGLEDLFNWASEAVADANDPRMRRTREHRIRRSMLEMIQHTNEIEAKEKYSAEVLHLQRRVIALLQVAADKMEENSALKQVVLMQCVFLARFGSLQEELKQLQSLTWYREEAEAERKGLLDALSKVKKERDILEDLLTVAEIENDRVAALYRDAKSELDVLKNRRWWHPIAALIRRIADCPTTT